MLHSIIEQYKKYRILPIHFGIVMTLLLIPFWYRFPGVSVLGMGDFTVFYSAGFIIFWSLLWTGVWWIISGFVGFKQTWSDHNQRRWIVGVLIFAGWILLSWVWSYKRDLYPSVALGAALPFILAIFFAICVTCVAVSRRVLIGTLIFGLVWNSLIAALQVAVQGSLGLKFLGEFQVYPKDSGTAIVQAGAVRWLRPYALFSHPNMLGGFLVIGLLATVIWIMNAQSKRWFVGLAIFAFGFWCLLLTFSRSAWLGLAAGLVALAILTITVWWRDRQQLVRVLMVTGIFLIAAGLFFVLYRPFLDARTGTRSESVELRSTSDRAVYNDIAIDAIKQSPILGIGIGNFPWYAADYLAKTTFDLRGQPVHNVFLSAWSELGIIGLGLFIVILGFTLWAGILNLKQASINQNKGGFLYGATMGGIIAFLVIGLFDHYPWTLIQFQAALWLLMAVVIRPPSSENLLI